MNGSNADADFEQLARATLDDVLERHPEAATQLGDHRFDDRLSDPRPAALEDERTYLQLLAQHVRALVKGGKTITAVSRNVAESERTRWELFEENNVRNATAAYSEFEWE